MGMAPRIEATFRRQLYFSDGRRAGRAKPSPAYFSRRGTAALRLAARKPIISLKNMPISFKSMRENINIQTRHSKCLDAQAYFTLHGTRAATQRHGAAHRSNAVPAGPRLRAAPPPRPRHRKH